MSALKETFDARRNARLDAQLKALAGDKREFQRFARRLGGYVRNAARQNIRKQRTVDGQGFKPRAQERSEHRAKRRLLQGLADPVNAGRALAVLSKAEEGGGAVVTWKNGLTAGIAGQHQHGSGTRRMNAREVSRERKDRLPHYDGPCTRKQAQALIREGYRLMVPAKGGGRGPGRNKFPKRVTVQWIEAHFTLGHAGLLLRILSTERLSGKKSWETGIPARPFLGVTQDQANQYCDKLAKSLISAAKRAK